MIVKQIQPKETYEIRKKVLREKIPLPYKFSGDFDKDTIHFGVFFNDELVGVASFMKVMLQEYEGNHYQLRGMASSLNFQGKGGGKFLLSEAEAYFKELNCDLIWCNAREAALKFYKKSGYKVIGEVFNIEYIGAHYKMVKFLR